MTNLNLPAVLFASALTLSFAAPTFGGATIESASRFVLASFPGETNDVLRTSASVAPFVETAAGDLTRRFANDPTERLRATASMDSTLAPDLFTATGGLFADRTIDGNVIQGSPDAEARFGFLVTFSLPTAHTYDLSTTYTGGSEDSDLALTLTDTGGDVLVSERRIDSIGLPPFAASGLLPAGTYVLRYTGEADSTTFSELTYDLQFAVTEVNAIPLPAAAWAGITGLIGAAWASRGRRRRE